MAKPRLTTPAIAMAAAFACLGAPASQRAYVASYGSDANTATSCALGSPCRSFTAAHSVVDPGGEIVALDAAGYGAINVTKSVTITTNSGFHDGIIASSGNAVTIATPSINVTLRGLNISGIGASNGVSMTDGSRLTIERCVISGFAGHGVYVATAATVRIVDSVIRDNASSGAYFDTGATVTISGSKFLGNGDRGVAGYASSATTTTVAINDSVASGNTVGFQAATFSSGATAQMSITRSTMVNNGQGAATAGVASSVALLTLGKSMVNNNGTGLYQNGTSTLESHGNNHVRQNATQTSGTITTVASM